MKYSLIALVVISSLFSPASFGAHKVLNKGPAGTNGIIFDDEEIISISSCDYSWRTTKTSLILNKCVSASWASKNVLGDKPGWHIEQEPIGYDSLLGCAGGQAYYKMWITKDHHCK